MRPSLRRNHVNFEFQDLGLYVVTETESSSSGGSWQCDVPFYREVPVVRMLNEQATQGKEENDSPRNEDGNSSITHWAGKRRNQFITLQRVSKRRGGSRNNAELSQSGVRIEETSSSSFEGVDAEGRDGAKRGVESALAWPNPD